MTPSYSGIGFSVGVVASVILFRRAWYTSCTMFIIITDSMSFAIYSLQLFQFSSWVGRTWPIALSTGFGLGSAYADCDRSFNPARISGTRVVVVPQSQQTEQKWMRGRVEGFFLIQVGVVWGLVRVVCIDSSLFFANHSTTNEPYRCHSN